MTPATDPKVVRAALGAAVVGLLSLGAGRLVGHASATAADAPAATLHLPSPATESVRATLRRAGVGVGDANGAAFALAEVMDPEHPPGGLDFDLRVERADDASGLRLIALEVHRKGERVADLTRAADQSWRLDKGLAKLAPQETGGAHEATAVLQGPMEDVLYGDPSITEDAAMVLKAARLFARRLDMARDLALGDQVRLVFTRRVGGDGRIVGAGDLLYAEVDTRDGPVRLYRHRRAHGEAEFVDDQGVELDHALLRTPVDSPRITSDFGMRLHPLLGYTRMHQGLDFGAPAGSAVLAAGDGVVEELRWAGGYGRWIKLHHAGAIETGYGHLSAWAPGLRAGSVIRQGQVIGYVGSTGLSTGPHLHYEVLEAGRPVDPKTVQSTGSATLAGADRAAFEIEKQNVALLLQTKGPAQPSAAPASLGGGN